MTQPDSSAPIPTAAEGKIRHVELLISILLRAGVIASLVLVVSGLTLSFIHHHDYACSPAEMMRLTGPAASFPHTVPQVLDGLRRTRGRAFIMAGLLVLIATPVMRVAVSIVGFAYQKDRTFVVITSIVLALLLFSFFVGSVER